MCVYVCSTFNLDHPVVPYPESLLPENKSPEIFSLRPGLFEWGRETNRSKFRLHFKKSCAVRGLYRWVMERGKGVRDVFSQISVLFFDLYLIFIHLAGIALFRYLIKWCRCRLKSDLKKQDGSFENPHACTYIPTHIHTNRLQSNMAFAVVELSLHPVGMIF